MENLKYSPELLPMQGNSYERLKEPRVVTLASNAAVVNMGPPAKPPRDHIIWSLFSTIYMNYCCLGFAALCYSIKARDRKALGDLEGARGYASTARCFNLTTLILFLITVLVLIILISVGAVYPMELRPVPPSLREPGGV
ncbi:IFM5 protein, partial [Atractosteus spatula]|nr:IFM5 protein [Atractosteus spatula]